MLRECAIGKIEQNQMIHKLIILRFDEVVLLFFDDNLYAPVLKATIGCVIAGPWHILSF
jgi:hypothetical protein